LQLNWTKFTRGWSTTKRLVEVHSQTSTTQSETMPLPDVQSAIQDLQVACTDISTTAGG